MSDIKNNIISELENRIEKLKNCDEKPHEDNVYGKMNQALSCVLNEVLTKELSSIKDYVENL